MYTLCHAFDVSLLTLLQLCCAILGCWLTEPLNHWFGRRGTIFICALISFLACIWQGVTNSWPHLFVARFVLGLGIGPKSSTVPVYAAECAPPAIRGGLVMMWQMWTAFGIMLGYVADLAFYKVPDKPHITGLNWRLMLASVIICILFTSQTPTLKSHKGWYTRTLPNGTSLFLPRISALAHVKGSVPRCVQVAGAAPPPSRAGCPGSLLSVAPSSRRTFPNPSQDIHVLLEAEKELSHGRNRYLELFTIPRNRRATLASFIVMFM